MPTRDGPIEVWLRQTNMQVTGTVVYEDEHTRDLEPESLSMRGAQREVTGWFIGDGYKPVGRWQTERDGDTKGQPLEVSRRFVPTKKEQ
jgi:hypothetical protein